jgi:hypothetical protein
MSRNHPLNYPAPAPQKKHFSPLKLISDVPSRRFLFDVIFGHRVMREHFKKISGHETLPILIGAAVTATGHSQMLVRSMAVVVCAVWLSLDVGIWVSAAKWKRQYKAIAFCVASSLLCCLSMGIMYWFLISTLEDQQADAYAKLSVLMQLPANRDLFESVVVVTNGGGTNIGEREVACSIDRISQLGGGGIQGIGSEASAVNVPLRAGGDTQSDACMHLFRFENPPICGDVRIFVTYYLETQPNVKKTKAFRFVTRAIDNQITEWVGEPVDYKIHYCPPVM